MAKTVEKFHYIVKSDEDSFETSSSGIIQLKSYSNDLLFYASYDSVKDATYAYGTETANLIGDSATIENFGVFGQYIWVRNTSSVYYSKDNFSLLTDEGTIKFRLRTGFNNNPGYQDFILDTDPTPGDTYYSFKIYVGDSVVGDTQILLASTDGRDEIQDKLSVYFTGKPLSATINGDSQVRVSAANNGDSVLITDNTYGNSLVTLLGGVEAPESPNAPSTDTEFIRLRKNTGDTGEISLLHTTDSHIILQIFGNDGDTEVYHDFGQWNNYYNKWYAFELGFNSSIAMLFIDGIAKGVTTTGFTRTSHETRLEILASSGNSYRFDELMVYNAQKHFTNYTVETTDLDQYDSTDPYIDIYFGTGFTDGTVSDLNVVGHQNIRYVVKIGGTWYYYVSGAWRNSTGSYSQSVEPGILETQFSGLVFSANAEVVIRAYFHSDGTEQIWIDDIEIISDIGTAEPAVISGSVALTSAVDLSSAYNVLITTDQGSLEVNLKSEAGDSTAVLLDEIKDAINEAGVPGLEYATDDGSGHLILTSSTTGDSASIAIDSGTTADALSLVWGYESTDEGESAIGSVVDYSELFRYIRSQLGEPLIPAEITDEQLEDCVSDAVWWYNRWRNPKEGLLYLQLEGTAKDGYTIPAVVGGEENIIEIIMRPRYPFTYYAGRTDLVTNLYLQYLFQSYRTGFSEFLADYYITVSIEQDINIILGTQIKWEVLNGKLFIHPSPDSLNIAIRYRSALTPAEIVTNQWIREYTLAKAKIVLGNIRSTFKSGIVGGEGMMQLNGEDLKAEGFQELERIREDLKKTSEPLFLEFF
jgi:hypothetical protein